MSDERRTVSVADRRLTLTNLDKVLYPGEGITKAEVVQYYLRVAPTMIPHVRERALALVRYPDGIDGESFFQKNRPKGTPAWVSSATPPGEEIDYVTITEEATLAWLGNQAALEIHQQHGRAPHFDRPDYLIVDVDPPEGGHFGEAKEITLALGDHVREHGYQPLVKTTGGKGLHVVCPIEPEAASEEVLEAARDLVDSFRSLHPKRITLALAKAKRKGRVFLDVHRHNRAQTAVSPYSLRGRPGAPVALPISWERLEEVDDPRAFNLRTVPGILDEHGDAWHDFADHRTRLHTRPRPRSGRLRQSGSSSSSGRSPSKYSSPSKSSNSRDSGGESPAKAEPDDAPVASAAGGETSAGDSALDEYRRKRAFDATPEPTGGTAREGGAGSRFVIQRHHAGRLHYDFRLEEGGVLWSWAVPKGVPPRPGITRLAVRTEDHPLDYSDFEGSIPEGQYGAGEVWVFDTGTYEHLKPPTDKRVEVRLEGEGFRGDFRLFRKDDRDWFLQRVDDPDPDWLRERLEPMVPKLVEDVPVGRDLEYEVKWDGVRALIFVDEGDFRIITRNGHDVTDRFPELLDTEAIRTQSAILDGEIVVLDGDGHPNFEAVLTRVQRGGRSAASAARRMPATAYLFDLLYLDGRPVMDLPLTRRREWLRDSVRDHDRYRFSRSVTDGLALLAAIREKGLEGVVGKDPQGPYRPGKRHDSWIKIKVRHEAACVIIGYMHGKGRQEGSLGSLHIAELVDDVLEYRGRAGTGLTDRQRDELFARLAERAVDVFPLAGPPPRDARGSVWVEPELAVEIEYAEVTTDGRFRKPSIRRVVGKVPVPIS